jgi:hypothetical protein
MVLSRFDTRAGVATPARVSNRDNTMSVAKPTPRARREGTQVP